MNKIRHYLEIPYKKYKQWIHVESLELADATYNRRKPIKNNIHVHISIYDLLFFYLAFLGIITISLAVFVGVFLIMKDIFT